MNSENHCVLFGSAVTKWKKFPVTVLPTRTSRTFQKRKIRLREKMCESLDSRGLDRWTGGTFT